MKKFWSVIGLLTLIFVAVSGLALPGTGAAHSSDTDFPSPSQISPEKDEHSRQYPSMSSALARLVLADAPHSPGESAAFKGRPSSAGIGENRVRVIVEASGIDTERLISRLAETGANVEASHGSLIQVDVPVRMLADIAIIEGARFVRLPAIPVPQATTQALDYLGVPGWHDAAYSGSGVKVAILDGGFAGYQSLLGTELPGTVTVYHPTGGDDISGWGSHGAACAEIVADIAPEADMFLAFFRTEVEWMNAVDWLIDQEVDVISHSVSWMFAGPGDGTGWGCEKVAQARRAGVTWLQSAGNYGQDHWQGRFSDPNSNNVHNFTPYDETNRIWVQAGKKVTAAMRWDDPWDASANDYDLYLLDSYGATIASSTDIQDGDDHPEEMLESFVYASGWYSLQIRRVSANGLARFDLYTVDKELQHQVLWGSIMDPADASAAITVGAFPWYDPQSVRDFSGRGPTGDDRTKPDLTAPDGITTVSYGDTFEGTSASTAHAAGVAALLLEYYPRYRPAQIQALLEARALKDTTEKNNVSGSGRLFMGDIPGTILVDKKLPDDPENRVFNTIAEGIADAVPGDQITVRQGIYQEKVYVDKPVVLQGRGMPVVDAGQSGSAISLVADGCTLSGFDLCKGGWESMDGALQLLSNGNQIEKLIIRDSWNGLYLWSCFENVIGGVTVRDNFNGISVYDADSNLFCANSLMSNATTYARDNTAGNTWDNGLAGNYWDNYLIKYPGAAEVGDTGVWDTPYAINGSMAEDGYPLVGEPLQVNITVPGVFAVGTEFTAEVGVRNATPLDFERIRVCLSTDEYLMLVAGGTKVQSLREFAPGATGTLTWQLEAGTVSHQSVITVTAEALASGVGGLITEETLEIDITTWNPWIYDTNTNGVLSFKEMIAAQADYLAEIITCDQMVDVLLVYLTS